MSKTKAVISIDTDGNAFAIMGAAKLAMRRIGVSPEVITEYITEAMSSDYDHLLQTTMDYVTIK